MKFDFILLGAEKQAATSFATCYPEKKFLFVTDQKVVDGWDLKNVSIIHCPLNDLSSLTKKYEGVFLSLSTRYTTQSMGESLQVSKKSVFETLSLLYESFPEISLIIKKDFTNSPGLVFLTKGDFWHKPDASQTVKAGSDTVPNDLHGCELFYQEFIPADEKLISTGRVLNGKPYFAVVKIYRESIAREEYIIAAETIFDKELNDLTYKVLENRRCEGMFTLNWIKSKGKIFLTSIRPEPRSLAITLKKAGVNLLEPEKCSTEIATDGFKMIGDIHYSTYKNLGAC